MGQSSTRRIDQGWLAVLLVKARVVSSVKEATAYTRVPEHHQVLRVLRCHGVRDQPHHSKSILEDASHRRKMALMTVFGGGNSRWSSPVVVDRLPLLR